MAKDAPTTRENKNEWKSKKRAITAAQQQQQQQMRNGIKTICANKRDPNDYTATRLSISKRCVRESTGNKFIHAMDYCLSLNSFHIWTLCCDIRNRFSPLYYRRMCV